MWGGGLVQLILTATVVDLMPKLLPFLLIASLLHHATYADGNLLRDMHNCTPGYSCSIPLPPLALPSFEAEPVKGNFSTRQFKVIQ